MSAHAAPVERTRAAVAVPLALGRVTAATWTTLGIAGLLGLVCFYAGGGLAIDSQIPTEIGLTLGGAALVVAALAVDRPGPVYGAWPSFLLLALAAFTAASVIWSIDPNTSWIEGGRTLAYAGVFLGGVALVRLHPARWPSLLLGVLLAGLAVCLYALATRIFPGALSPDETVARLRDPFGYWNAVGLTAALAVPPALWLGARRGGHAAVGALAYPALVLLFVTLMLAYSRGALLALAIGLAFYFATVPLRLRSLSVLVIGVIGAAPVVAWDFSRPGLSADNVVLGARVQYGHLLGLMLVGVCLLIAGVGLGVRFAASRWPPSALLRRRAGVGALVALALVPVAFVGALSVSSRGLGGSVSHAWRSLTDPHASTPPNDPSRLTAIGSVRARYWNDALKIARDHPVVGVGAGGYPTARNLYRSDTLLVQQAHGYVVQTLADLGVIGLALSLVLGGAWALAAIRAANPFGWGAGGRRLRFTPERMGLLTMITCVIIFTFHSLIDWTWFIPGDAVIGLLCAGWVAGRGPHRLVPRAGRPVLAILTRRPVRAAAAAAAIGLALMIAWSTWQPLRSEQAANTALAALARHDFGAARTAANTAVARDPLAVDPRFDLASIETAAGRPVAARNALVSAVRVAPSNASAWEQLAAFDFQQRGDQAQALRDLGPALYLDPQSYAGISRYLDTLRGAGARSVPTPTPAPAATATRPPPTAATAAPATPTGPSGPAGTP